MKSAPRFSFSANPVGLGADDAVEFAAGGVATLTLHNKGEEIDECEARDILFASFAAAHGLEADSPNWLAFRHAFNEGWLARRCWAEEIAVQAASEFAAKAESIMARLRKLGGE